MNVKKSFIFIGIVAISLVVCSCHYTNHNTKNALDNNERNSNNEHLTDHLVRMDITRPLNEKHTDSMIVTIQNNSDSDFIADGHYSIERQNGGTWEAVPFDFVANDYLVVIEPGNSYNFKVFLYPGASDGPVANYKYTNGKYRIVKGDLNSEFII